MNQLIDTPAATSKQVERPCACCGGTTANVLHHQDFAGYDSHPLARGYDVVACERCGFVYADSWISQQTYDAYYEAMAKYADKATGTGGTAQAWDLDRQHDTAQAIAGYIGSNRDASILDIGCANGGLLKALKHLGYHNVCGIDPAAACVSATRAQGMEAWSGLLGRIPVNGRRFDCIVLSHVLEHIQDLDCALRNVAALLNENGCVYVEVPDAARYADYLYAPFQDFNTEHINHFSAASLGNLMGAAGFNAALVGTKTIRSSETSLYPALFGIFERGRAGYIPSPDTLEQDIRHYIDLSAQMMSEMHSRLRRQLAGVDRVVIWGTGQLAMKVLTPEALGGARIIACADGNSMNHGRRFFGAPVVHPDELYATPEPIIVASLLHQSAIVARIQSMGLDNRVITLRDDASVPYRPR